uniref:Uncharacterized protein n=1 Tax=Hyaloperonospora arabidopsidis (strain Emoy2) TaxID=559515 RepID=M4BTD4_HYAAE
MANDLLDPLRGLDASPRSCPSRSSRKRQFFHTKGFFHRNRLIKSTSSFKKSSVTFLRISGTT